MYRRLQRLMPRALLLVLIVCAASVSEAYVEDVMSLATPQFHNRWGSMPQQEWEQLTALYRSGALEQAVDLLGWMEGTGEFDLALVLRNRALVLKDLGAYAPAIADLARLADLAGEPDDRVLLGWTLYQVGRYEEAVQQFELATSQAPADPWGYYGLARASEALGLTQQALAAYEGAVAVDGRFAPAYYHMGLFKRQIGDDAGALAALTRAISLDPSYTELYEPLAELNEAAGNIERAWRYYRGAALRYPNDAAPKAAVARLAAKYEEEFKEIERAENAARLAAAKHRTVQPIADPKGIPLVRVGLAENQSQVRFSSGGPFRLLSAEGKELGSGPAGQILTAIRSATGVTVRDANGDKLVDSTETVRLEQIDPTQTFIVYDMVFGQGYYFATIEHRQYRGSLELLPRANGLTVVNEVNMEEYLYSVVPSEMYATMPIEALKVQAMAARTYTLRNLGRYKTRGFDVLGSVASSEYRGVDREHANTTQAVDATRGLVLRHGNSLIEAVYSADHGGHSAASADVWGGENAYLPARLDAAEDAPEFPLTPAALHGWLTGIPEVYASTAGFGIRSTFRWAQPMPAVRLQAIVDGRADIGRIQGIVARGRAVSGHVSTVEFIGTKGTYEVSGDRIRSTLGGIKSNLFRIEAIYGPDGFPQEFLITGGGSGHGVGMSQLGAAGRALAGQSAQEIVAHYYPNVTIARHY